MAFIYTLAERHPDQTSLIVTHDCVINALYAVFAKIDLGTYNGEHCNSHDFVGKFTVQNSQITTFAEYGE